MTRTKIAMFDLASPAAVWGFDGCLHAWIVVRAGARVLGMLWVELLGQHALSAATVRQLAVDEFGIGEQAPEPEVASPPVSVIVCTRNRPLSLRRCLSAIANLDYPEYEVIVVDNGSTTNATAAVVGATPFRYIREDRLGLDRARNRGWIEARHSVVAYVDDDTVVDRLWLHGVARAFSDPTIAGVTGLVLPYELDFAPQMLFEAYGGMSKGFEPRAFTGATMSSSDLIAAHQVGVGANMAFRRAVLHRLGGFDPALDVGTVSSGGGDLDMFHRVLASGLTMRYEPAALVWHQHRRDRSGLRRQIYQNGRSFGVYLGKIWARRSVPRQAVVCYALHEWAAGWLLPRVWRSVARPRSPDTTGAWAEILGVATAPWAYWRSGLNTESGRGLWVGTAAGGSSAAERGASS